MSNVNRKYTCGICEFLANLDDTKKRDELIGKLNDLNISSENLVRILDLAGKQISATRVRVHRREKHVLSLLTESNETNLTAQTPIKAPSGWEPYSEHTETIGKAIVHLPRPNSTHRDLLIQAGFNPDEWQISGQVNTRKWMRYDQEWLYYYKFDVIAGESPEVVEQHVDELVQVIRSNKPQSTAFIQGGEDAFTTFASDWQIGKREGNDGTPQTIDRVLKSIDMTGERIKDLRKLGHKIPTWMFAGLGDIGEGTCGFYPGQQFLIDRNRRDQGRINRELITKTLDYLAPMFDNVIVPVVGGNHGENRSPEGKRITSDGDNDDCAYFDAVREAFDRVGDHNIEWKIMEDELSMGLTVAGVPIGLTHGHLFERTSGSTAQQKAHGWWKNQDFGFQSIRGSRILVSAHFHHFSAITYGGRTHLQTPAMDPGSKWFREIRGEESPPGVLSFRIDKEIPLGWDNLTILSP